MSLRPKYLSKFLSLILRHRAEKYGITVAPGTGYADMDEVETVCAQKFRGRVTRGNILDIVRNSPDGKLRFEVKGRRIRALYGHSQVEVTYPPVDPPEFLYHGTSPSSAEMIMEGGLKGMGRQYVHLTADVNYARRVAGRRCPVPVLLRIRAAEAAKAGIQFACPDGKHYLARTVSPEWLELVAPVNYGSPQGKVR